MIELHDIKKEFARGFIPKPVEVLKGLTFTVRKGEVFGYLGPNGAGKTTTIKILVNLIAPNSGSASINGIDVSKPEARRSVGYLPEQPYYYDYLTGGEFLDFCGSMCEIPALERKIKAGELLERVGLSESKNMSLRKYSRGMLQRIGIAQALINDPDVLILDEPLAGLDPQGRREMVDIIIEQKARGKTIFFSSHILADAETFCDRIGIINKGKLIAEDKIHEIAAKETGPPVVEITFRIAGAFSEETIQDSGDLTQLQEHKYRIEVTGEESVNSILCRLINEGAVIDTVNRKRMSLEELYLKKLQ